MIKVTSWEQVSHETVLLSLEVPYIAMKGVVAGRHVQYMAPSMACGMIRTFGMTSNRLYIVCMHMYINMQNT